MALSGGNLRDYVDNNGNVNISSYSGYSGGNSYSGDYSGGNSNYNSVNSNYKDNAKSTAPLAEYNPYTNGVPQSIIDAENELNFRSIPNQEYAQQVQDTIIRDNLGYLSDPNYKGTYSAIEASQAFDYLTRANEGASYSNWATPKADDRLFTEIVPQWDAARNVRAKATEQYNAPLPTAEQSIVNSVYNNPQLNATQREILNADKMKHGDWNLLSGLDQFKAVIVPSSNIGDSMENAPWWAKIASNIFPSLMAAGGGAAIGQLFGPVGAAIGGGVVGGLTFLQGVTGIKIPVINELLEGLDILSVWFEQGQGAIGATLKETWDRSMADGSTDLWELGKTMGDVLKDFPDLWEVGQFSYEVGADLGFDNIFNAGRNLVAGASDTLLGTNFGQVDTNAVSRANMGLGGLYEVAPDSRGYDSLTKTYMPLYRMMRDEAVKQGMSYKDAKEYAVNNLSGLLVNYMGTTGLANDFGASAILDPLNFLPTIEADVAAKIGDKTNNVPLQKAAAAAKNGASPIVDAFSVPLIQPIVEFITGKHETQGLDTIMKVYAKELQQSVPVKDMSSLQRRIAGIDNNGLIKNFEHESNPIKRYFGLTEESKIYNMSENLISLLGSSLFDTDISPEIIPELISEFVGISPITPDGPLGKYADTALMKTMQSTMGDITIKDIQDIQKRVDNFRNLNINRVAIDTVAEKLHMKKGDIFDMLDDPKRSVELKQRILKENITLTDERTKITWSPNEVYQKIDAFSSSNVGRSQYNLDMLKVDIMESISRKSQDSLLKRYNIKPDAWFNRLSELGKDVQSIVLLNYSPSYFINNFLNNIITRSVVGVGGFDNETIKTANQKRGVFYSRGSEAYDETGRRITAKKSKDDLIGKAQKKFSDFTDDKSIRGKILKGFNNIDIENIETRAAFEIGANRYWEATWKPGLNLPELPKELTSLGFTPEMNQTIYKLAMDSNTLTEFKQKLAGDVILPGASSTLGQMLQKKYTDAAQVRIRNLIDSMPFIREAVDDILATGNPEAIRAGFQTLIDKLTSNVDLGLVQQLSTEFNDLATRIAGSGFAEFITSKMAIDDVYGDIWINQSTESEMLFAQRIATNRIPEDQFRPEYEAMLAKRNGDYAMARKFDVNHLAATIVALGINEDTAKQLIINKLQQYDNMQKYITEEHNLFMKFADQNSGDYDYAYYAKSKLEMLERVQKMQLDSYKQYDQLIIQYLRDNLDKSYTEMIDRYEQNCKDIQRLRENLNTKEIEWVKARMDEPDIYERHKIAEEQNQDRYTMKMDISTRMFDANRNLQALDGGFDKPKNNGKVNLSLEQTLWLELLYREANETVANAGEFLEHFIDKSDPKTIFEPSNFSNTNVNESFVEYGKRTQSPENIEAMRKVYESGDAVPLGAVDVKNERISDEVMGRDYTSPIDAETIDADTTTQQQIFTENTNTSDQQNYETKDNNIDLEAAINELNENIKDAEILEPPSPELSRIIKDTNKFISLITDERTGKTVNNYYFYDEARKSILQDIIDKKPIKDIVINAEKNVIETAKRKIYGMLKEELKSNPEQITRITTGELQTIIDYFTNAITLSLDSELFATNKDYLSKVQIDDILDRVSDPGRKYLNSILRKTERQIDLLQYWLNNFTDNLYSKESDVLHHAAYDYDTALDIKAEPAQNKFVPKDKYDNLSQAKVELDVTHKTFDSFDDYEKWLKDKGITLPEDEEFIPRKYQSEKYLSDLKESIIDANKARIAYEEAEEAVKTFKKNSEKGKSNIFAERLINSELKDNEKYKKNLRDSDFVKTKNGSYKVDNGKMLSKLKSIANDRKNIFGEKQKNLIIKFSTDDYYQRFLDRGLNFPLLFQDMETGPKFLSNSLDLLDNKPVDNTIPVKTKTQDYSYLSNLQNTLQQYITKGDELVRSRQALQDYKKGILSVKYDDINKQVNKSPEYINITKQIETLNKQIKKLSGELVSILKNDDYYKDRINLYGSYNSLVSNPEYKLERNINKTSLSKQKIYDTYFEEYGVFQNADDFARLKADLENDSRFWNSPNDNLSVEQTIPNPIADFGNRDSDINKSNFQTVAQNTIKNEFIEKMNERLEENQYSNMDNGSNSSEINSETNSGTPKNIPVETKQIPIVQQQDTTTVPQPEPTKPSSPKPTNQKIDSFIESGIKKIIDNNKADNPKLQKISAKDLKAITNSLKVEVYNKTGNNIDSSDIAGWDSVLKQYIANDASAEKINTEVIKFIDQATEFKQRNSTNFEGKREFQPYKANWQKSDAKLSMIRTQPFYYGDQLVKAGVLHNGEIIAYITTTMPDTISVGGYTFPVIGVDTFDPNALWLYVKDEPIKVTPGKPNGIDYSVFAENGEHPMRYGTTPTTQPWGTAAWETSLPLREALELWRDEALEQLQTNLNNGSFFGKLNPDQQKALYNWVDGKLMSAYNYQRFASQRYGNTMVDLSMLNYNDRHGFDNTLTSIMPYQYWLTRSVMNWGARMIDQPKWFSMYARLEKLIEKNKRDFLPSRLEGMVGLPMPFLPEGQGQGLYFDPFNVMLPHKQFYNMTEYFDRNLHTIHKNAISVIEEHYREGRPYDGHIITKKDYDDAMLGKGELYNKVFWDQRNSDETNTGLSGLVGSLINPNVLISSVWKAIEANNGNGKDISYSPMYKLGNTLRASARDTAAEGIFNILADALQTPDKTWRNALGVESDPIGSAWTDYWTVKYLTDMLYTKEHGYNEVTNAIAEGESNPLWQEARNRYSTSEAYKQQGGALLNDIMQSVAGNKQTSVGNLAGSALVSLFGGHTSTSGEEDFRRMQDFYNQIKNDDGMRTAFSEEFPEYKVGFYANVDDKDELLHKILVDNCWNTYNALPQTQKNAVYEGLGKQFQELFINKESRATDRIDDRTLIEWTQAMHGNVPNISTATINQPMQDAFNIQWYSDSLQGLLDRYNRDKQQRYPGIDTIEQGYFNTPLQDQYLALHPELKEYWNWKESTGMANPPLGTYFKQQTAQNQVKSGKYSTITEAVKAQVNNYTKACLKNHIEKGWTMPAAAINQLKIAYTNLGVTIPFETWLKEIKF